MSGSKGALRSMKTALESNNFEQAESLAEQLLKEDPKNYHGYVFLGLAQEKLNNYEASEKAYDSAVRIRDNDRSVWQGLINLYEKQGSKRLDKYHLVAVRLAELFALDEDKTRCQSVIDKYVLFAKKHGSRSQYKEALQVLLPTSSLYETLEGGVPHPSDTYLNIIEIAEAEEREFINREIGERRTRLGAKADQVKVDVEREAFGRSELDQLYSSIINWAKDDEVRRKYEEKLLQRAYDTLLVLPTGDKPSKRDEVRKLARDMVIIKHPFELAWKIVLEWQDGESLSDFDVGLLREFVEFFPEDGLGMVLRGFLECDISPFPRQVDSKGSDEEESDGNDRLSPEDRLLLMAEGLEECSSILSHRIMGELYLSLEEHRSTVDVARKAQEVVKDLTLHTGLPLQNTLDAINTTLASGLTYYQSPRHHMEAKRLFEAILNRKPTSNTSLLGIGIIMEEDEDYVEAIDFLSRALEHDPENIKIRVELAWCKALSGQLELGLQEFEKAVVEIKSTDTKTRSMKAETLYRIGYCQWHLNPSKTARKDHNGPYANFIASLKTDPYFAPAYTSLGIYYADYARSKRKARTAFQKAFELSSSELEAAERLARLFADQGDWDLVEVVAQRVVDSGKARPAPGSKKKAISWPFAALGVVEINKQQYTKSIVSFQAALRISPGDYDSWVGLGESYHNSGRYIAATRAFKQAETLESKLDGDANRTWFAKYMLANVKRELGMYDEAIAGYEEVLLLKDKEFGVSVALLQTLTESAWRNIELGLFGDAADGAKRAIEVATDISSYRVDAFNLWKAVGDACSIFSWTKAQSSDVSFSSIKRLLETGIDTNDLEVLADVDGVGARALRELVDGSDVDLSSSDCCMYGSILGQKRALLASAHDVHAQAVAWYNLGWAEHRAHSCIDRDKRGFRKTKNSSKFLKAALRCFKRAIELEAGNSEFWNALGVVTTELNPKVAQHSFVRSLHLNDKNARVWTNLGALYLIDNDHQLANEAFTRAQSADPDFAHAWLGQGLLALLFGDPKEARSLFTHAFEIANSSLLLPKRQYALSTFDHLLTSPSSSKEITHLIQPLFALHQLHSQVPSDLPYEHLLALFAERLGDFPDAEATLQRVCKSVEAEYEDHESASDLSRFAQAKADLARAQLARQDFQRAAESAETALDLSAEEGDTSDPEARRQWRLSAHLTAGLAYYYLKLMDKAIGMFRNALEEANSAPEVVSLLAQVLWAKGGEEERNVAREQLFECVERHPDHVGAVTLLGVIAFLDGDEDALEAVESDLRAMRTREGLHIDEQMKVEKVLTGISALESTAETEVPEEVRRVGEATAAVMLSPGHPQGWTELAAISSDMYPAEMALKTALRNVPPRGALDAADLCKVYAQTGRRGDAQRAIMVATWLGEGWDEFSHSLSGAS